jgi:hypothetical protein
MADGPTNEQPNRLDGNNWFVSGENVPALNRPIVNIGEIRTYADFVHGDLIKICERMQTLPRLDLMDITPGELLLISSQPENPKENAASYAYLATSIRSPDNPFKRKLLGNLLLDPDTAHKLGIPLILKDVNFLGATSGGTSIEPGKITQTQYIEATVPVTSLGNPIDPMDKDVRYTFLIPPVTAIAKTKVNALPSGIQEQIQIQLEDEDPAPEHISTISVTDWPGRDQIALDEIKNNLFRLGTESLRSKYWVHPETGALFKKGFDMHRDVWSAVAEYADSFANPRHESGSSGNFSLTRAACFAWWALKLGLTPDDETMAKLEKIGLKFELPEKLSESIS